ncbi:MAG: hypothetical protein E6H03_09345 [Bacillati bacterium ANGP1]|uniref:Creatinase N-terminal domain-containing protein n=1 Tax=Candidatus Segetimicrobium genomatis TaxID=2569760 RepID=A0A537J8T8_9BACT|nr:MAG: hypothetical protein E6H03_09345 [Terrabacteria group bacterium ANGP1]
MPSTPRDELDHRIGALQHHLRTQQVDAALISQNIDLFYFTGSMQSGTLLVPADGRPVYAVRRVFERARTESALEKVVALESFRQLPDLLRGTAGRTPRRIGLEYDVLPVAVKDRLAAVFGRSSPRTNWTSSGRPEASRR